MKDGCLLSFPFERWVSSLFVFSLCAISVRSTHYESMDFGEKLSVDVAKGKITKPDIVEVNLYSAQTSNLEHASDKALIVVCQVV